MGATHCACFSHQCAVVQCMLLTRGTCIGWVTVGDLLLHMFVACESACLPDQLLWILHAAEQARQRCIYCVQAADTPLVSVWDKQRSALCI